MERRRTYVISSRPESSDNRALVIALALVLGALEARTGKDAWRHPAPLRQPGNDRICHGHTVTSGDYLRFLAANGYNAGRPGGSRHRHPHRRRHL